MKILQLFSTAIVLICVAILILKTIWNLILPFEMIRHSLKYPEKKRGRSVFIFLDLALAAIILIVAAIFGGQSSFDFWILAICGLCMITASFLNFFIILFTAGILRILFQKFFK